MANNTIAERSVRELNTRDLVNFAETDDAAKFLESVNNILAHRTLDYLNRRTHEVRSTIMNELYEPTSPDEQNFVNKHVKAIVDYPVQQTQPGLPFRDTSVRVAGLQHKKPASYEKGEDKLMYENHPLTAALHEAVTSNELIEVETADSKTAHVKPEQAKNVLALLENISNTRRATLLTEGSKTLAGFKVLLTLAEDN